MATKPRIVIVGPGNLGTALAVSLRRAGYSIDAVVGRSRGRSMGSAAKLAKQIGSRALTGLTSSVRASGIWFCVADGEIANVADTVATEFDWKGKVALHSSGALASDELGALRRRGASVASVHPLMTFVPGSQPPLTGVSFAIEGDPTAVRMARRVVNDFGGHAYSIRKADKVAYHAWGTFASPLLTSLLATGEAVAAVAGVTGKAARKRMIPILLQTLANYAAFGAAGAFSGPIIRGDTDTVKRHLRVLRNLPEAREVYVSLARAALLHLPARNNAALEKVLR